MSGCCTPPANNTYRAAVVTVGEEEEAEDQMKMTRAVVANTTIAGMSCQSFCFSRKCEFVVLVITAHAKVA